MITACHNHDVIFFVLPGHQFFLKISPKKAYWVKQGGPAFFPHWMWYDHIKSKPNLNIFSNWGFWFSSVPGGRILPILQECPICMILIRIYSDIHSYCFFDTNIFGYSFISKFYILHTLLWTVDHGMWYVFLKAMTNSFQTSIPNFQSVPDLRIF